jgi:type IV pilus assembly protein PilO
MIFVVLMVGLLGTTYVCIFQKANARREARLAEIRDMDAKLVSLRSATSGIADMGHKIEELQKAIEFFEKKLPQEKEIDKILKEVWQIAEANSLQTKTVKTLKSERSATYSEQPVMVTLCGDFNGFYSFMLQLEKLPRITRVTQMKLTKINDHDGEMQAQMTLSIFFEPDANSTVATGN